MLTTDETFAPVRALEEPDSSKDLRKPEVLERFLADGYGKTQAKPGLPIVTRMLDGSAAPAPGPSPKLVTRFVHLADTQLADDESPTRLVFFDSPGDTSAAFRPHEASECRILNAAVRTINVLHQSTPFDFVLLGGDNADSAQENELDWFHAILDGSSRVECDSGIDNDPVPGPDNDPKDPFVAEGLKVPWRWVMGNHDVLVQGNLRVEAFASAAIGTFAGGGTRDWSKPGGPMTDEEVPADPRRAVMSRDRILEKVMSAGDGHGIDAATRARGKAFYTFDAGDLVRIVVLDTAAETGGASGLLRKGDIESFVVPALEQAKSDGKLVIVTSHHGSRKLGNGTGLGGSKQADAVSAEEWQSLLGSYDNILVHLAGHTHEHHLEVVQPPGKLPYWEAETSALVDYPHQVRIIEVWDQDNGFVSVRAIAVDYQSEGDPLAADGRERAIVDHVTGNGRGKDKPDDQNVEFFVKKPAGL